VGNLGEAASRLVWCLCGRLTRGRLSVRTYYRHLGLGSGCPRNWPTKNLLSSRHRRAWTRVTQAEQNDDNAAVRRPNGWCRWAFRAV